MKFLVLPLSIILLIILVSLIMGDKLNYLIYFFFCNSKFGKVLLDYNKRALEVFCKERDKNKDIDNAIVSTRKIRRRIFKTLFVVLVVIAYSFILAFCVKKYTHIAITESGIHVIQVCAVCLVLWALLGRCGWEVQTHKGVTLPEYINDLWFRTLNVISAHLFLFSYFYKK